MTERPSSGGTLYSLRPFSGRRKYSRLSDEPLGYNDDGGGGGGSGSSSGGGGDLAAEYHGNPPAMAQVPLQNLRWRKGSKKSGGLAVISSYVFDWVIILVVIGIAAYLDNHAPNRRPFSLEDPDISFPFTEHETVPSWLLITLCTGVPIIVIPIITLVFIPGRTVPAGTPGRLVWRRRLWELHAGWLGLAMSLGSAWFLTNGMKNLCGKPRPDLLARCNADVDNLSQYVVGGSGAGSLVSAGICRGMDGRSDAQSILEDGFRSYPSGHSSSSAAGLIYLSLFIASKFAITFPFLAPGNTSATAFTAFPSRVAAPQTHLPLPGHEDEEQRHRRPTAPSSPSPAARRLAAAPPLYLAALAAAPPCTAVFIACSRWFDFRHHGFDVLFGFLIGTACALAAFRWYQLPLARGAGWAWGPRTADKAWWAGVGSLSYAVVWGSDDDDDDDAAAAAAAADEEEGGGGGHVVVLGKGRKVSGPESPGSAGFPEGFLGDVEARRRLS